MEIVKNDIETFIHKHKSDFDKDCDNNHEKKFLVKLANKFKKFINIVPYLVRVFIITIIIFLGSIWIWNEYLRKDRNEVTLKQKIINIITTKNEM